MKSFRDLDAVMVAQHHEFTEHHQPVHLKKDSTRCRYIYFTTLNTKGKTLYEPNDRRLSRKNVVN